MNLLELNIEVEEVPTDLSRCYTCKETIFGKMYQYVLRETEPVGILNSYDRTETKFKLCESCYNLTNE